MTRCANRCKLMIVDFGPKSGVVLTNARLLGSAVAHACRFAQAKGLLVVMLNTGGHRDQITHATRTANRSASRRTGSTGPRNGLANGSMAGARSKFVEALLPLRKPRKHAKSQCLWGFLYIRPVSRPFPRLCPLLPVARP